MNNIKECAELYSTLLNKDYLFTLEGGISFKTQFSESNFVHLLGLEKLTDINQFQVYSRRKIYKDILDGTIRHSLLCKSSKYKLIENRIKYFQKIPEMLNDNDCKIIIDFNPFIVGHTELKKTKYILYRHVNNGYVHFTLGENRMNIYPETFFYENSKRYISEQKLLDIISIKVSNFR